MGGQKEVKNEKIRKAEKRKVEGSGGLIQIRILMGGIIK